MHPAFDVAVVGAGAAGLAAAIFAARQRPGLRIAALDSARKLGAKILVSGGGRCNLTNRVVTADDFRSSSRNAVRRVLAAFTVEQTLAFFEEIGVRVHEEEHGKLFPNSNSARAVVAALLAEAARQGVALLTEHRVTGIERAADHAGRGEFVIISSAGRLRAGRVVLATGGRSLPKTGSDGGGYELARRLGHTITPTTPALVPLVLEGEFHRPLSGVSHEAELAVHVEGRRPERLRGSLLWTHFGVSGPVVLDASGLWHRARLEGRTVRLTLSFRPGRDFEREEAWWIELAGRQPRRALHNVLAESLPARVADALLAELGIASQVPLAHLERGARRRLVHALTEWPLPVRDSRGYTYAEVTAGGVPLREVDPGSMASRCCPGLFLVGEILDVDGRIGGFNFQWAWSSGFVAGRAAR